MKKIGILLLVVFYASVVFPQPPQGGGRRMTVEERAQRNTEWMTKELNLTKEQVVLVDSVNLLFAKVQQSYFQAVDGDWDKVREAMITLGKEKENAFSKILTEEQLENYKAKIQEMTNNRGSRERRQQQ